MVPKLQGKGHAVPASEQVQVSVAIVLPFEPKIMSKAKIEAGLKNAVREVEKELFQHFSAQLVKQATTRLKTIMANLDYSTHRKSVAIFLSPFLEKVYYWNIAVREKVVVSPSFSLRELIRNRPEEKTYLALVLNANNSRIYLGNGEKLTRLVSDSPRLLSGQGSAFNRDEGKPFRQFMQHFDNSLSIILASYPLPVFVLGSDELRNSFLSDTKNSLQIMQAAPFASDQFTENELLQELRPLLNEWDRLKEQYLLANLEEKLNAGKLAVGMNEVWMAAKEHKSRLLVVEEDYVFPAYLDRNEAVMYADAIPLNDAQLINDAVEDVLEKVLADGGNVELVQPGALKDYLHIALVRN